MDSLERKTRKGNGIYKMKSEITGWLSCEKVKAISPLDEPTGN